jgi:hypothetical protein
MPAIYFVFTELSLGKFSFVSVAGAGAGAVCLNSSQHKLFWAVYWLKILRESFQPKADLGLGSGYEEAAYQPVHRIDCGPKFLSQLVSYSVIA